jgi:hypothetical protein
MAIEFDLSVNHVGRQLTEQIKKQFERIYEETDLVLVGTLGRTAVMGGEPHYWYRQNGEIRDIDVYDPSCTSNPEVIKDIDMMPLPIDTVGMRWLKIQGETATLALPRDDRASVAFDASILEPELHSLLGVPVRTFSADVMMGLNKVVPYDRIRQRKWVKIFEEWVASQENHSPEVIEQFSRLGEIISETHPEYIRMLKLKDYFSYLPKSAQKYVKKAYNAGVFKGII